MAKKAWHDDIRIWLVMAVAAGVASAIASTVIVKQLNLQAQARAAQVNAQIEPSQSYASCGGSCSMGESRFRADTGYSRR